VYALARYWKLESQEVLFPNYFHGVELQALLHAGVRIRFYPVDRNMRIYPERVIANVTPQSRAVYLIHYLGFPGPVEELKDFCRANDLVLIEDCALALFSKDRCRFLGSFGDASIFCIHKTLPVPNGGALWLKDSPEVALRLRQPSPMCTAGSVALSLARPFRKPGVGTPNRKRLRDVVAEALGIVRIATNSFVPADADLGMSGISHRILNSQKVVGIVEKRRRNYLQLVERLGGTVSMIYDSLPLGVCPLFFPIRVANKNRICADLVTRGIELVNFWSIHHPLFPPGTDLEIDELRATVLEIPCHQDLKPDELDWMANQVIDVIRKAGRR
jgi:perosamine synthetase